MVNWSTVYEQLRKADSIGEDQLFSTQNDRRDCDDEKNLPTQTVAPREPILRLKPADAATDASTPRQVCLQLPIDLIPNVQSTWVPQLSKILPIIGSWFAFTTRRVLLTNKSFLRNTLSNRNSP